MLDIFGNEDTRTEEEKAMDEKFSDLLAKYENRFNEQLSTECLQFSTEEFIEILEKCLKENASIDKFYPGINDLDDDCDY